MESKGFLIMVGELAIFMLNDLNFVFAEALVGTSMGVSGIFIAFNSLPNLAALLPEGEFSCSQSSEDSADYRAHLKFSLGKRTVFFNTIEKIDDDLAVCLLLGDVGSIFLPNFEGGTSIF